MRAFSFADFTVGSPICAVNFELITKRSLGTVPAGLARHLTEVCIECKEIGEDSSGGLNLGVFSDCPRLTKIEVVVRSFAAWERVWVGGLEGVPTGCRSIAVRRDFARPTDAQLPLVRYCAGWVVRVVCVGGWRAIKLTRAPPSIC